MHIQMERTLIVLADGEPVTGYARARLIGVERLGLYPSLFMLHLWNVAEEDYLALSRCKEVTVLHEDVVLVSGTVSDVLGASLGLSRADTSAGVTASDVAFRDFIQKKLIRWGWDGRNVTVPEVMGKIQPGATMADNQNGTVTVTGAGTQPASVKELFPVSAGIRAI